MFAIIGIAGGVFLLVAVIAIFYFAGNRGKQANDANQEAAGRGHKQDVPHEPARTQGRGDL